MSSPFPSSNGQFFIDFWQTLLPINVLTITGYQNTFQYHHSTGVFTLLSLMSGL
jgi:hypothetical protein